MLRENDHLQVMPYSDEMRKFGIVPVSILTELAHVVKDAGRAVELVSRLNKLNQLRDSVDNKGSNCFSTMMPVSYTHLDVYKRQVLGS